MCYDTRQLSLWSKILICRIEEITLEAWLIVGAIVFAAVGAVVITWFALIVRICRIYCSHRKSEVSPVKQSNYFTRFDVTLH